MNIRQAGDETLDIIEGVRILQKKKGHRFTTDSILLAKFSTPKRNANVLELGAGCGIVSILLAKRNPSIHITAVEIQKGMAGLATRNVLLNEMETRITVLNEDIKRLPQIFPPAYFDHIITNPPYRLSSAGRISPDIERTISRKEFAMTLRDIMKVSQHLLKVRGRLSIAYTAERLVDVFSEMRTYRIEPKIMQCFCTRKNGEVRLAFIQGVKEGKPGIKVQITGNRLFESESFT